MQLIREWHHLTWGGRVSIAWYPLRRLLITPAPQDRRCYMGAPCGEDLHCPREAIDESLWCRRHQKWVPMTDRLIFLAFGCMAILAVLWLATAEPLRPVSEPVVLEGE